MLARQPVAGSARIPPARLLASRGTIRMNGAIGGCRPRFLIFPRLPRDAHVMNDLVATKPDSVALPEPATRPIDEPAVARALADIAEDSRSRPETYLRDTIVPHGGE